MTDLWRVINLQSQIWTIFIFLQVAPELSNRSMSFYFLGSNSAFRDHLHVSLEEHYFVCPFGLQKTLKKTKNSDENSRPITEEYQILRKSKC